MPAAPHESALLLPVPAAEPAVARHRARLDASARDGVPAHITVLYPFLPPAELGDEALAAVRQLIAGIEAFDFTLDRIGWFGEAVTWLGPRDPAPFRSLTDAAFAAFPSCPPYGGVIPSDGVIPHLTVGHLGGREALREAAAEASAHLPIAARAVEVIVMSGPRPGGPETPPGQWRTIAAFPLGRATRRGASVSREAEQPGP